MTSQALGGTVRRGALLSLTGLIAAQSVSLVQTLVLARLLVPREIGVYAAGTVLSGLLVLISEGGLRQGLIRHADEGLDVAANTVFVVTLLTGLTVAVLALAASPLIGDLFDSTQAEHVAAVTSGGLFLQSFANVPDALLQRGFRFRRRLIVDPGVALAFATVAIIVCALGGGVWGLVAGFYAYVVTLVVIVWSMSDWRPGGARPTMEKWRELASFASPLVVTVATDRSRQLLETSLVGGVLGTAPLGRYRYGRRVGELPGRAVVEVGAYVLFPTFARLRHEISRLGAAWLRVVGVVWTLTVAAGGLLAAIGTPLVTVVLGRPWHGSGVVLQTMAAWGPGVALSAIAIEAMKALGHTRRVMWLGLSTLVVGVGSLLLLVTTVGLQGAGLALSVEQLVGGLLAIRLLVPFLDVTARQVAGALWPAAAAAAVAAGATAALETGALHSGDRSTAIGLAALALDACVYAAAFAAVVRAIRPGLLTQTIGEFRRTVPD